ncbi:hypothetical protein GCM10028820_07990 [Tessaracoccus terricola]
MRTVRVLAVLAALLLPFLPIPMASADEPGVTITGSHAAGSWVTAVVADLEGEAVFEWLVDGVPTPSTHPFDQSEPSPWLDRFFLREEYLGARIGVRVAVTTPDGATVSMASEEFAVGQGTILANQPVVSGGLPAGELLVGQTLTADPNVLYPQEGVTITYQWFSHFTPIPGATSATLELTDAHLHLNNVNVEVTAAKAGWATSVRYSDRNSWHEVLPAAIKKGNITLSAAPRVGEWLMFDEEGWDCCDETATYEFLLDGRVVETMVNWSRQVTPKESWVGKSLVVRVTRSRVGVSSVTASSAPRTVLLRRPAYFSGREWAQGKAVVGWPTEVYRNDVGGGFTETVQWVRVDDSGRETPIPGATGWDYRYTVADIGYRIGVRGRISQPGHETRTWARTGTAKVQMNLYTTPGERTVNGRQWRTTCEKYSHSQRCRTEIWATQVVKENGRWTQRNGWVFNNLTYLPMLQPHSWVGTKLGSSLSWSSADGGVIRDWKTVCDDPSVGRDTCRTYITAHVTKAQRTSGGWRFVTTKEWVFNNMVYHQ